MILGWTTVSILVVWEANGLFYARSSIIAFKIAPPSKGSGSLLVQAILGLRRSRLTPYRGYKRTP